MQGGRLGHEPNTAAGESGATGDEDAQNVIAVRVSASDANGARGVLSWADAVPAEGVVVALAGEGSVRRFTSDAEGAVVMPLALEVGEVPLLVKAPCWRDFRAMNATVVKEQGADTRRFDLTLPLEADIEIVVRLDSGLRGKFAQLGLSSLAIRLLGRFSIGGVGLPRVVQSVSRSVDDLGPVYFQMPIGTEQECVLHACDAVDSKSSYQIASERVNAERDRVVRVDFHPGAGSILHGRVQDHTGVAIPHAFVEVRCVDEGGVAGVDRFRLDLTPRGEFVFVGDLERRYSLRCAYEGVEAVIDPLVLGGFQAVVLDLSVLVQLALVRNGVPIDSFLVGSVFACEEMPKFQKRRGVSWVRARREDSEYLRLSWPDALGLYEIMVQRPPADAPSPYVIEATHHDLTPTSRLHVKREGISGLTLGICRVQPLPPSGMPPELKMIGSGDDVVLYGIGAGRYRVDVTQRLTGGKLLKREAWLEIGRQDAEIDVGSMLAR